MSCQVPILTRDIANIQNVFHFNKTKRSIAHKKFFYFKILCKINRVLRSYITKTEIYLVELGIILTTI